MNTFVKCPSVLFAALLAPVAFGSATAFASNQTVMQAHAVQRARSVKLVRRARRVFLRFAAACLTHDRSGIARALTDDVAVEYALPDLGMTLTVDTGALEDLCSATALAGPVEQISNLYIFPTSDPNTMFVQYDTASRPDSPARARSKEHLIVVTLRRERISRIRDFTTAPGEVASIVEGSAHNAIFSHR
jgi:hypothetical protein